MGLCEDFYVSSCNSTNLLHLVVIVLDFVLEHQQLLGLELPRENGLLLVLDIFEGIEAAPGIHI